MSIDAIAYVKTLPPGAVYRPARALLFVIAENTFNDTGECRVGQRVLVAEADIPERTLRRYLHRLESDGMIARRLRARAGGGRLPDCLTLCGFLAWLKATRPERAGSKPAKVAGSALGNAAKLAGSDETKPANRWPDQTGQQVAASIENPVLESRTDSPLAPQSGGKKDCSDLEEGGRDAPRDLVSKLRSEGRNVLVVECLVAPVLANKRLRVGSGADRLAVLRSICDEASDLNREQLGRVAQLLLKENGGTLDPGTVRSRIGDVRTNGLMIPIRKGTADWAAWRDYFSRTSPDEGQLMDRYDSWQVPAMWPPARNDSAVTP